MENRANMIKAEKLDNAIYQVSFLPSDIENLKAEIQMLLEVSDPDLQVTFDYHNYTRNFNFYHGQIENNFKNNEYKEFNKDILLNDNDKKLFRKLIKINRNIVNIYKEWVQILEGKPDVGHDYDYMEKPAKEWLELYNDNILYIQNMILGGDIKIRT